MGRKSKKIEMAGGEELALDNPFGSLDLQGLPQQKSTELNTPISGEKRKSKKSLKKTRIEMRLLKGGKGGKIVTELQGWGTAHIASTELKALKKRLGTGGTCKGTVLEIQGDARDQLEQIYLDSPYRLIRAGG